LAETERLFLPTRKIPTAERFAEFHMALQLEREGFVCWGACSCFGTGRTWQGQENTTAVRDRWKKTMKTSWPKDVKETLNLRKKERPRNPDIVAYHKERKEWRFDGCSCARYRRPDSALAAGSSGWIRAERRREPERWRVSGLDSCRAQRAKRVDRSLENSLGSRSGARRRKWLAALDDVRTLAHPRGGVKSGLKAVRHNHFAYTVSVGPMPLIAIVAPCGPVLAK
jgi:hypothetical protein